MASTTPNYGFATDVVADDLVEPTHHNRLADVVDRALGEFLTHIIPAGAHEGWAITASKEMTAGQGLLGACWCRTSGAQAINDLTDGALNYVYGVPEEDSAPDGAVRFVAQIAPPGPGGAILLGTIELDADGNVLSIDNQAPGVQRSCHRIAIERLEGTGIIEAIPGGATVFACVSHVEMGEFRAPGDLQVSSEAASFEWEVTHHHRGDEFRIQVTNNGSYVADFTYTWSREGIVR